MLYDLLPPRLRTSSNAPSSRRLKLSEIFTCIIIERFCEFISYHDGHTLLLRIVHCSVIVNAKLLYFYYFYYSFSYCLSILIILQSILYNQRCITIALPLKAECYTFYIFMFFIFLVIYSRHYWLLLFSHRFLSTVMTVNNLHSSRLMILIKNN